MTLTIDATAPPVSLRFTAMRAMPLNIGEMIGETAGLNIGEMIGETAA